MPRNTPRSTTASSNAIECDMKFKLVIIGESTVGKSCITKRLVDDEFSAVNMMSTIGLDLVKKSFQVDNLRIMLDIWDTAGQERFHSITTSVYRGAKGIILVYDVTNSESFRKIRAYWLKSLEQNLDDPIPMFLIGNKIDLVDKRVVPSAEGQTVKRVIPELKDQQYFNAFFETSAKTGENIQEAFQQIASILAGTWGTPRLFRTKYELELLESYSETFANSPPNAIDDNTSDHTKRKSRWTLKPAIGRPSIKLHHDQISAFSGSRKETQNSGESEPQNSHSKHHFCCTRT